MFFLNAPVPGHCLLIPFLEITVVVQWSELYFITEPPRGKTNNVVSEQVYTNRPVQSQKKARSLKFRI